MNTDVEWMRRRACDESEAEVFFPALNDRAIEAKAICGACPVVNHCLKHALDEKEEFGVWGGLTEAERRAVLRRRARINGQGQGATISVNEPTDDERCGTYAGTRAHRRRLEWLCDPCKDARSLYEMDRRRKQIEGLAS